MHTVRAPQTWSWNLASQLLRTKDSFDSPSLDCGFVLRIQEVEEPLIKRQCDELFAN